MSNQVLFTQHGLRPAMLTALFYLEINQCPDGNKLFGVLYSFRLEDKFEELVRTSPKVPPVTAIGQYSLVKENCRRGTARIKLSLEAKILDAVPLQCISFEPN